MAGTSDRTILLIDYIRGILLNTIPQPNSGAKGTTYFSTAGYLPGRLYRQNTPQAKDPEYPCLIFSWDPDDRERTTDIDHGVLTVTAYTNTYTDTEQAGNAVADALHLLTALYTDPTTGDQLYIFQMHDMGGPAEPQYAKTINAWSMSCSFRCKVG